MTPEEFMGWMNVIRNLPDDQEAESDLAWRALNAKVDALEATEPPSAAAAWAEATPWICFVVGAAVVIVVALVLGR